MLKRETGPLYHQLKELLTEKIESGEWAPGRQLPTEMELSQEFGVSRSTVRQAMALLEINGLVERFQGRGTFVGRPKFEQDLMLIFSPMRGMSGAKTIPSLEVEGLSVVRPSTSVASRLQLPLDELVYELKRRVVVDGEPLMMIRSWLPRSRFPDLETEFQATGTIFGVLRRNGIERVFQHKELEVTILDEEEAAGLETRVGAPALLITYLTRAANSEACEFRRVVVRGDRCRYYVDQEGPEFLV